MNNWEHNLCTRQNSIKRKMLLTSCSVRLRYGASEEDREANKRDVHINVSNNLIICFVNLILLSLKIVLRFHILI